MAPNEVPAKLPCKLSDKPEPAPPGKPNSPTRDNCRLSLEAVVTQHRFPAVM